MPLYGVVWYESARFCEVLGPSSTDPEGQTRAFRFRNCAANLCRLGSAGGHHMHQTSFNTPELGNFVTYRATAWFTYCNRPVSPLLQDARFQLRILVWAIIKSGTRWHSQLQIGIVGGKPNVRRSRCARWRNVACFSFLFPGQARKQCSVTVLSADILK